MSLMIPTLANHQMRIAYPSRKLIPWQHLSIAFSGKCNLHVTDAVTSAQLIHQRPPVYKCHTQHALIAINMLIPPY